jgi:anti-sigma factor RsiW
MTCTRYETDLALYVERDLSDADAAAVEAHLGECPTCPSFLAELRASQALVKDLATEEVPPEALAAVRVGLGAAAAETRPRRDGQVAAWAAAAAIVLALGALAYVVPRVGGREPMRTAVVSSPPSSPRATIASPVITPPSTGSTIQGRPTVSPRMEQARRDRPPVVPALSPDDADQLARAVVAISRIERVDGVPADAEPSRASAPLMRLATADPDVVIYWQLEPSGGE